LVAGEWVARYMGAASPLAPAAAEEKGNGARFRDPSGGHDPAPAARELRLVRTVERFARQPDKLYCARVIVTRYR